MKYTRLSRGNWIVDLPWPDGVRNRLTMPNQEMAEHTAMRFRVALLDGSWPRLRQEIVPSERKKIAPAIFGELADRYMKEYSSLYNRSLGAKRSRLKNVMRHFDRVSVAAIDGQSISRYIAVRQADDVSNATINQELYLITHILAWARENYLCDDSINPRIRMLPVRQYAPKRAAEHEIDEIMKHLDPEFVPLITFVRETGCRVVSDAMLLKPEHVDRAARVVTFADTTKNGKHRQVPLTDNALAALDRWKWFGLTPTKAKREYGNRVWRAWVKAREDASYPSVRIHDLRHAYAIRLAEAGVAMHFISDVMGHNNSEFTRKVYARFSPESSSRAVLKVLQGGGTKMAQVGGKDKGLLESVG